MATAMGFEPMLPKKLDFVQRLRPLGHAVLADPEAEYLKNSLGSNQYAWLCEIGHLKALVKDSLSEETVIYDWKGTSE
jgi:hypothetical protein